MVKPTKLKVQAVKAEKASAPPSEHTLSKEDAATMHSADMAIAEAQRQLGFLREQYILAEDQGIKAIVEARGQYNAVLLAIAKKYNIDVASNGGPPKWNFDPYTNVFSKNPVPQASVAPKEEPSAS